MKFKCPVQRKIENSKTVPNLFSAISRSAVYEMIHLNAIK